MSLDTWKEVAADSLFEYVTSGSRGWAKYYDESGAVFIRMGNLDHGTIELDFSDIQHVKLPNKAEGQPMWEWWDWFAMMISRDI